MTGTASEYSQGRLLQYPHLIHQTLKATSPTLSPNSPTPLPLITSEEP